MAIRIKLRELMEFRAATGDRVSVDDIAAATGIGRATLFRMLQEPTYNTTTARLDLLCRYFGCELQDVAEVDRAPRAR